MKALAIPLIICSLCLTVASYAADEIALNRAIRSFDSKAQSVDKKVVLNAISQQTKASEKNLETRMRSSQLTYGELVTAESLAEGSGKSFETVLAMKGNKEWTQLSKELKIDPASIANRVRNAEATIQMVPGKAREGGSGPKHALSGMFDRTAPSAGVLTAQPKQGNP